MMIQPFGPVPFGFFPDFLQSSGLLVGELQDAYVACDMFMQLVHVTHVRHLIQVVKYFLIDTWFLRDFFHQRDGQAMVIREVHGHQFGIELSS